MSLQDYVARLSKREQYELAIRLCRLALPIWENYAAQNQMSYQDSVVGLRHVIPGNMLRKAVNAIEQNNKRGKILSFLRTSVVLPQLKTTFLEPITALQDIDWELPYPVERTLYAVYNLLNATLGQEITAHNESTIYASINQSCDAILSSGLLTTEELNKIL